MTVQELRGLLREYSGDVPVAVLVGTEVIPRFDLVALDSWRGAVPPDHVYSPCFVLMARD
jgi:hypothetical protein